MREATDQLRMTFQGQVHVHGAVWAPSQHLYLSTDGRRCIGQLEEREIDRC